MLTLYKISKQGDNNFYIGSTNDFSNRKRQHKNLCKTRDIKLYQYIRENGGWDTWNMEKIGECDGIDGESKYIKKMKPSLNSYMYEFDRREYEKEWRENNKEYFKAYEKMRHKKYYKYKISWGGDKRYNNNLLNINPSLFH